MARMVHTATSRRGRAAPPAVSSIDAEERIRMIGEAAYYRYAHRGYAPGHDLDDWLAAEAEFDRASRRELASHERLASEPAAALEPGVQLGGARGPAGDDVLKRDIKRHPQREIGRIESMEPGEAPLKE